MTSKQIKQIRENLGFNQVEFAMAINASVSSVTSWEQGKRNISRIYAEKVRELAENDVVSVKTITLRSNETLVIKGA